MKRSPEHEVRVFESLEELSAAAAHIVLERARTAIEASGVFSLALSGGSTPDRLYRMLGSEPRRSSIDWKGVQVFWADERAVPPDHGESNFRLASETFLSKVPIPRKNIHRIMAERSASGAAEAYEGELRRFFGGRVVLDLILLGVGEDGHTASLFPGSEALREASRLAIPVSRPATGPDRVTLTLPALNSAAMVLFLLSGRGKAGVLREILQEGNPKGLPAGLVRPRAGRVLWLVDREAASEMA